jgi:hypothetical protein
LAIRFIINALLPDLGGLTMPMRKHAGGSGFGGNGLIGFLLGDFTSKTERLLILYIYVDLFSCNQIIISG